MLYDFKMVLQFYYHIIYILNWLYNNILVNYKNKEQYDLLIHIVQQLNAKVRGLVNFLKSIYLDRLTCTILNSLSQISSPLGSIL